MKTSSRIVLALLAGVLTTRRAMAEYTAKDPIKIGGEGRWDYVSVDPAAHRLYVTRSTHTQAVDLTTGKVVLDVAGQQRSHGVVAAPATGRGFITDGKAGTIVIFDLKSGEVLGNVAAAEDADGLIFDGGTNKVLATCGDANKLVILDPTADPRTAKADTVDVGGKPEFLAADGKGMVYCCVNDKNLIAAVDLKTMKVTASWPIGTGTGPTGLSIDAEHGRLFVGCHNKKMVVLDTAGGKVLAELPIGTGNDACGFDPGTGEAFASCGDGTMTVVKETGGKFDVIQTVKTPTGARTMTVDPSTHTIYLPTAEFNPAQAGERRPAMKPGSFMIAVVSGK